MQSGLVSSVIPMILTAADSFSRRRKQRKELEKKAAKAQKPNVSAAPSAFFYYAQEHV
jgi:hypothetical protein